jgi:uncharacterized DUF497 family protein
MADPTFEWDEAKAASNLEKHGVSFVEATDVFNDPFMQLIYDDAHSDDEDRFLAVGETRAGDLLVVAHVLREDRIRLISARDATGKERREYEE